MSLPQGILQKLKPKSMAIRTMNKTVDIKNSTLYLPSFWLRLSLHFLRQGNKQRLVPLNFWQLPDKKTFNHLSWPVSAAGINSMGFFSSTPFGFTQLKLMLFFPLLPSHRIKSHCCIVAMINYNTSILRFYEAPRTSFPFPLPPLVFWGWEMIKYLFICSDNLHWRRN